MARLETEGWQQRGFAASLGPREGGGAVSLSGDALDRRRAEKPELVQGGRLGHGVGSAGSDRR
jgi:hypothetical protein